MKKFFKIFGAVILGLVIVLTIAILIKPKFWLKIINPIEYDMRTVNTNITQEEINLDFEILLSSNYFLNFLIDSLEYDIYFDSTKFSSGKKFIGKSFKKNQVDTLQLPLTIERDALKNKMNSLGNGDSTNLRIKFHNYVELPITGKTKITIPINRKIAAPQLPKFNVVEVIKEELSLNEAIYTIVFEVNNPNGYEITINEIDAKINFPDLFSGKATNNQKVAIKPQGKSNFSATINIDNLELVRDGLRVAFRPNKLWKFNVDVQMKVEQKDKTDMIVNIFHEGEMELMGRRKDK